MTKGGGGVQPPIPHSAYAAEASLQCSGHMLLALDVHKAQQAIQDCLKEQCNTYPVYVPAGTTSIVQPADVVFNAPFKAAVERQAKHLQENLDSYVQGTINVSERKVLNTKWVGGVWGWSLALSSSVEYLYLQMALEMTKST